MIRSYAAQIWNILTNINASHSLRNNANHKDKTCKLNDSSMLDRSVVCMDYLE
jgi:hypothetical protein